MIYNMVGSGAALNYKVVGGTSEPVNPKENTIWVRTETPISIHIFRATEPPETLAGMVWIATGTASTGAFNALKKNFIQICPLYAKQYVDGAWKSVTAKIYKNGAWVEWTADIVIYDSGVENIPLTLTNVTKAEKYLKLTLARKGNATIKTGTITVTGQTKLTVVYSNLTGDGTFEGGILARVRNADGDIVAETTRSTSSSGTLNLDITTLNGEYVVEVYANNSSGSSAGSCRVSSIKVLMS